MQGRQPLLKKGECAKTRGAILEAGGVNVHVLVLLNGLLLSEANSGDGRRAEDSARNCIIVWLCILLISEGLLCKRHALQKV